MTDENDTLGLDILKGVPKIADFTGEPKRRVYYLLEHKLIPAGNCTAVRGGFPALAVDTRDRRLSRRRLAAGRAGARRRPSH